MRHLLIHQYDYLEGNQASPTENIEKLLHDIFATNKIDSPFEIHIVFSEEIVQDVKNILEQFEFITFYNKVNFTPHIIRLNKDFQSVIQQIEQMLSKIISPDSTIYLDLSNGNRTFQHMIAHELSQQNINDLILFSRNEKELSEKSRGFYAIAANDYLSDEKIYHHVKDFVVSGNFKSAKKIINNKWGNERFSELLDFGNGLFQLDVFKGKYFEVLFDVLSNHGAFEKELEFIEEMKQLLRKDQRQFIYFLYDLSNFYFEENRLIDFSVIYYRLIEEFLLFALGWDIKKKQLRIRSNRKFGLDLPKDEIGQYLHKYEKELRNHLKHIQTKHNIKIRKDRPEVISSLKGEEKIYAQLYFLFKDKDFNRLLDLRHNGVGGHGFEDLTKEEYIELSKGVTPNEFIKPYLDMFDLYPKQSLIKLIQKAVLIELDQQLYEGAIAT
ncbi:hypothetical protein CIB95_12595 [Lottiidibacillus patelloidae]|uniref:CRISPR-associated protein n=1 Tax=Lottiidibacillus patelloidae TaxID=2670334 RepID=A0A263BSV1_9BACI|nr:hypothetical protein [Lottiidibacillus patelloidae]OZM56256.1 hypothetical protein CIB95_12595 [Lottiidibacillus patelloidae]